ncbi:Zn-dependent alcohol dehydrogenase [Myxococcota bacterium]|nr:Zn-dependent alcohol dehydrogenase [Myxococcota bacterium]
MRAALLVENQKPLNIVDDVEVSEPGPGQVLVRVSNCGICHSDLTYIDSPGMPLPVVLGHEAAGVVEAVGPGVTSLARGDQVTLTPLSPCGRCYYCSRSQPTLCVEAQSFLTGLLPDGTSPLARGGELVYRGYGVGGFGEYLITTENGAIKIPEDTPLEVACLVGCAIQTGVGAVLNTAGVEAGATVLVIGLGGIGVSIVQGARVAGASRIIASDPVAERRDAAANFGATDILDPTQDDVVARTLELTGGIGVDYAFDGAGGAKLVEDCIAASRPGGTTVMVGAPMGDEPLTIPIPGLFLAQEKKIMGSLLGSCHSQRDVPRLLALWQRGLLDLDSMISHRRPLADINEGIEDLRASRGIRTVLTL